MATGPRPGPGPGSNFIRAFGKGWSPFFFVDQPWSRYPPRVVRRHGSRWRPCSCPEYSHAAPFGSPRRLLRSTFTVHLACSILRSCCNLRIFGVSVYFWGALSLSPWYIVLFSSNSMYYCRLSILNRAGAQKPSFLLKHLPIPNISSKKN